MGLFYLSDQLFFIFNLTFVSKALHFFIFISFALKPFPKFSQKLISNFINFFYKNPLWLFLNHSYPSIFYQKKAVLYRNPSQFPYLKKQNPLLVKDASENWYVNQLFNVFKNDLKQFVIVFGIANHFLIHWCTQLFASFQFKIHKDLVHSRILKQFFNNILSVSAIHSTKALGLRFCCCSCRFTLFNFPKFISIDLFFHFRISLKRRAGSQFILLLKLI